ncbi:DUF6285 domain-containing protein [Micromonospora sp. NPDC047465]|uniref:DUF6285 domain-containing protein n=1 Tax=Micromonospora sp. NPDC047465 TaxID=3154813 RepID=UPI0033F9F1F3
MTTTVPPRAALHDVPTAAELVAAVREFLADEVLGAVAGATRFHTRVAMNALGIVERELAQGGADVLAHRQRLARLGYADDAGLAEAIRSGAEDGRYAEVKAAIAESVAAKLRVANPAYLKETP